MVIHHRVPGQHRSAEALVQADIATGLLKILGGPIGILRAKAHIDRDGEERDAQMRVEVPDLMGMLHVVVVVAERLGRDEEAQRVDGADAVGQHAQVRLAGVVKAG